MINLCYVEFKGFEQICKRKISHKYSIYFQRIYSNNIQNGGQYCDYSDSKVPDFTNSYKI